MDEIDSSNQYYCRDDNDSYYWQNKDDSHNRYLDEVVCPILMKNCIFPTLVPTDEGFPLSVAICMVSPVCPDRALSSSVITRTVHTVYPMYSKAIQLMHTTYMVHLGSILGTHPSAFTGIWYVSLKLMGLPISWNGPDRTRPDPDPNPRNGPKWRGSHERSSRPPEFALTAIIHIQNWNLPLP